MGKNMFLKLAVTVIAGIAAIYSVFALDIEGKIVWSELCKDISELGQSNAILNEGSPLGGIQRDGSFIIPDVTPGAHILSIVSHDFQFDQVVVNVSDLALPEIWMYTPGTPQAVVPPSGLLPYPISLSPRTRNNYFVERESFNLLGMLQNPMMLMMIGTGALMLGMPYLMKNLDPEVAKEVRERQAKMASIQNSMQSGDFHGGLSNLLSAATEDNTTPQPSSKKLASNNNQVNRSTRTNPGTKNKRR